MTGLSLFYSSLFAQRRTALLWSGALALLTLSVVAVWPSMSSSGSLDELVNSVSPEVAIALGLQDYGTPAGFLNGNLYAVFLPLLFGALGISVASSLLAGDEDAGRLELLFALPITRFSVYLSRFIAITGIIVLCALVTGLVVFVGGPVFDLDLSNAGIIAVSWSMFLIGLLHAAIVLALSGIGLRAPVAMAITGAVLAIGYLLHAVAPLSEDFKSLQKFSPWYWALRENPLVNGFDLIGTGILLVLVLIALSVGLIAITRRTIRNA